MPAITVHPGRLLLLRLLLAMFLLGFALPQNAHALTCSATITDVDFGSPNLLSASNTDALAPLTVTCTGISILTVVKMCPSISDGSGGSNGSARLLDGPGDAALSYQLYQDSSRTSGWGAIDDPQFGTVPAIILTGNIGGGATATRTIYARVFGGQSTLPAGNYNSAFAGAETAFTYSVFFLSASGSCTGFVGASVIRPEFDVVASPGSGCVLTTTDLAFPATGVLTVPLIGQTALRVTCTRQTLYSVSLDNGRTGATPIARKMTSPAGAVVTYGLYRDAARTAPWGALSGQTVSSAGTGAEQKFDIYGVVPSQITPMPGAYSDRIVVTLTY